MTSAIKLQKKIDKYQGLITELQNVSNIKVVVIPVVTGAFGTMSKRIHQYKIKIDIPPEIISIQKTAILGIAYTLQRVLGIKKVG